MISSTWTPDRVALLVKMGADKERHTIILEAVNRLEGPRVTTGALAGRMARMGINTSGRRPGKANRPRSAFGYKSAKPSEEKRAMHLAETDQAVERQDAARSSGERRLTLVELTEHTCRWPIGDPQSADFYFCGDQTLVAMPYCALHSRTAYQPNSQRGIRP